MSEGNQLVFFNNEIQDDLNFRVETAIKRLKAFEPKEGYYLAFSGGKDSVVIKALADMAGVKYDSHYSITTVDPPELTKFIKKHHPDVEMVRPPINMWDLIIKKRMPPTRIVRFCCAVLKEEGGTGRTVITGVRWDESSKRKNTRKDVELDAYGSQAKQAKKNRKQFYLLNDNDDKRRMMETCMTGRGKHIVNPIIDWTDEHVWKFIKMYKIPYCKLYDEGYKRLGCLGCPMQGPHIVKDFISHPYVFVQYLKAFDKMVQSRIEDGLDTEWTNGHEAMAWWINMKMIEYASLMIALQDSMTKKNQQRYIKYTKLDVFEKYAN